MRALSSFALATNMVIAAFGLSSAAQASASATFTISPPEDFAALAAERETVLDVYYGGQKLGQARVLLRPGMLEFSDPAAVAALIPGLASPGMVAGALGEPLPTNAGEACAPSRRPGCGALQPADVGIILDEEQFRVDIFVNRALIGAPAASLDDYLDPPQSGFSMISLFGGTLSASSRGPTAYHLQNRSIASMGAIRLRSDSSVSDGRGLSFDNLTAEMDDQDRRYIAGLFHAPGTDLVGRRQIVGIGIASQLDTRADGAALMATPLSVYLQQTARVDVLVDGRLAGSKVYPAGNQLLDTSDLPNGSYDVELRISEDGAAPRTERRFFTKDETVAPLGHPLASAFIGLLDTHGPGLATGARRIFYQASLAYRLDANVGLDVSVLGTGRKGILQAGASLFTPVARLRLAALTSTSADYGVVLRGSTAGTGRLAIAFDLRKIVSRDGRPLLPVTTSRGTFSEDPELRIGDRGSYTQGLATISYPVGRAMLRLSGLYRRDPSARTRYSVAASLDVPVVRTNRWNAWLQSDARMTDAGWASFVGVRLLMNAGSASLAATLGARRNEACGGDSDCLVGEVQGAWSRPLSGGAQVGLDAAAGRDVDGTYGRASGLFRSTLLNARADLLHQFEGRGSTQYSASIESGVAVSGGRMRMLGREFNDSGIMVSVTGEDEHQTYAVMINGAERGKVSADHPVTVLLEPYESYSVRLRPTGASPSSYDSKPRTVTLYPGNVARLQWASTPLHILFGRAVRPNGRAVSSALVTGGYGVGQSDAAGRFQIEARSGEQLALRGGDGSVCHVHVPDVPMGKSYFSAGDLMCQ